MLWAYPRQLHVPVMVDALLGCVLSVWPVGTRGLPSLVSPK